MTDACKLHSGFVIDLDDLTPDEKWNILLYCCHDNNKSEQWEITVEKDLNWLTGSTKGQDTGKFYEFLVSEGLDKKIEIVRG